ncbi:MULTISPECIES: GntR family transcriptional regulator [unclassified Sphingomonas]|uniref:GntR family transcriptional regulator n=1 Tax=unclassified Sphingomonas TaxID=196159 RepID=UPI0021512F60|nr:MULTISPECIES: GntR family transcriptional regulator [unclassified Sphingomonas]MCR5869464.1 GntR family transcriptional regulator [Sphingomonas sp. J344]UUX98806.1 GntR family transcriptional regulator [Sphingomonas sp. J315]
MPRVVPLAITISPGDSRSIAGQIVDAIRRKISAGDLAVGGQLPSVRGLAQQLSVNPNTVSKAYGELVAGGWLVARAGLGLYVAAQRDQLSEEERDRRLDAAVERFVNDVVAIRCSPDEAITRVTHALGSLSIRQSA